MAEGAATLKFGVHRTTEPVVLPGITWYYQITLGITSYYHVLPPTTKYYPGLPRITEDYQVLPNIANSGGRLGDRQRISQQVDRGAYTPGVD